jgi:hypothetical protein
MREDPRLAQAKAVPIVEIAERLGVSGLKRAGREQVGPCPVCGGRDRFGINPAKGVWNCRHCGAGDGIGLIRHVLGCDFRGALDWLMGAAVEIDPAELARREAEAARARARREAAEARARARAVAQARDIWHETLPAAGTAVCDYLRRRGLPERIAAEPPHALRFHPDLPYMVQAEDGRSWVTLHRGPAMVAGCLAPDGRLTAVHRTWIDLARPNGKALLLHRGEAMPAKKVWGSKKGTAIRLSHPWAVGFDTLVMGEGIETTLTAMAADAYPGAAYWAGVDLGNMSGQRIIRGDGMKFAGIPDLEDAEAFLPPPCVRWLIFVQDGDSDPQLTRAKLVAGLRRARARSAGLRRISIVHAGQGRDLNDIVMEAGHGQGEGPVPSAVGPGDAGGREVEPFGTQDG